MQSTEKPRGDSWSKVFVIHNCGKRASIMLPSGKWKVVVQGDIAGIKTLAEVSCQVKVDSKSTTVLYQD